MYGTGTSVYLQDRLQSVLNADTRLVYSRRTSEHTTPLLRELHWLRIPKRIQFRLCVLAYHCVQCTAQHRRTCLTSEIVSRRCLRSDDTAVHDTAGAVDSTARFRWLQRGRRTVCHQRLGPVPHLRHFSGRSSLTFPSIIRLTWRCLFRPSADVCVSCTTVFD